MDIRLIESFREKLRQLERLVAEQMKKDVGCCGVSLAQCHTILEIGSKGEASVTDIAGALNLDKSTLSRTVDSLVNTGLVNRVANPEDRRYVLLTLTPDGEKVYREINATSNEYYWKVFENIPVEKREELVQYFGLFVDALGKTANCCCSDSVCPTDELKSKE